MSIVNELHKNWDMIVDNFDGLCVHTIFNTKVLVISLGNRHGTRCSGYVDIITIGGKRIIHYPGKNIIDGFEYVSQKNKLFMDLLLNARLKDANDKINKTDFVHDETIGNRYGTRCSGYYVDDIFGDE